MSGGLFIWVQHLFGRGHLSRMARIAQAVSAEGLEVTVVAGGMDGASAFAGERITAHQLPPLRAIDAQYTSYVTLGGTSPTPDLWAERKAAMLAAVDAARPSVVMVDLFPFGRRKFANEVAALVEHARAAPRPPTVLSSVRDIVEPKADPTKRMEMVGYLTSLFDGVLVHGDEGVIPLDATAPDFVSVDLPFRYTGYIAPGPRAVGTKAGVVVSAGGGPSGSALLATSAKAGEALATEERPWHVFVPDGVVAPGTKNPRLTIHPFGPDFADHLARAEVSISEAGYNTVCEALSYGVRPVLVPYGEAGQTEQPLRARAFAEKGLAVRVAPDALSVTEIESAIAEALALPPASSLNLSGAKHTAVIVKGLRH